jgi:hypothetical protein
MLSLPERVRSRPERLDVDAPRARRLGLIAQFHLLDERNQITVPSQPIETARRHQRCLI